MIEYNGIGNFDNPTIYIETFQNLVKSGKYEMIFIFKDENEVMYYNHDCFTEIKICHDNCEKCDAIPDDVTGHPTKCTNCLSNFYPLSNVEPKDCYLKNDEVQGYFFDNKIFKPCYPSCASCTGAGTDSDMKCNTCKSSYTLLKDSSNKISCLTCDVGGNPSYDSSIQQTQYIYESASDCPPTKQKYVSSQKLCYKDCPNTLYQIQISF